MQKKLKRLKREYALAQRRHVRTVKRHAQKPVFTVPALTFLALLLVVIVVWLVYTGGKPKLQPDDDTNIVMLSYDKQEQTVPTRATTVGQLLDRLKIKLHEGDVVEPTKYTEISGDNFRVNVYRAVPVTIVDGDKKTFAYSAAATARSIVKQSGMTVYPEDRLQIVPTENFVTESSIGERVVIERATPVNVNLYGTSVAVRTHATTVRDLLKEKNIRLGKDDTVQPALNAKIDPNEQVFLVRKGMQIATQEVPIDMPVETVEDKSLSFGTQVVRQQGAPGKKLVTFQIELQNGVEIGRKIIQEVVAQEPVKQVVAKGVYFDIAANKTSVMAAAGIKQSDYMYVDYIVSKESRWNYQARNTRSGAYGLCQALPATKMSSAGSDWQTNPVTQLKWCNSYATGRYGTWSAAYAFWQKNHWW